MSHDLDSFIATVRKPLLFASKKNFSNLVKIKNLESTIHDSSLRFLSGSRAKEVENLVLELKNIFTGYDSSGYREKKKKIKHSLKILDQLRELEGSLSTIDEVNPESTQASPENLEIRYVKGVGPKISSMLNKRGIYTVEDILFYSPRRYDDRRHITPLSDVVPGGKYTVMGKVESAGEIKNRRTRIFKVVISEGIFRLELIWFNFKVSYLRSIFKNDIKVLVNGEIGLGSYKNGLQIIHPAPEDIEVIEDEDSSGESVNFNRIVPVYPLTEGLTQRRIRKLARQILDVHSKNYRSLIPIELIEKYGLSQLDEALEEMHFPPGNAEIVNFESDTSVYRSKAHRTVAFFEFFILELALTYKRVNMESVKGITFKNGSGLETLFLNKLPFELTRSQKKVLTEIYKDMESPYPMNRLLQGDVGSGKTIVALLSILKAVSCGYQTVFMVPTEILAEQHLQNIRALLESTDIRTELLKSGLNKKEKNRIYSELKKGEINLVIGTHALIQEEVEFANLGFVVIDEQHRFGVLQRAKLVGKGAVPDVLIMTATPIPRTLAITVYGDLNVSVIDELPPGRKNIETYYIKDTKQNRIGLYKAVKEQLKKGRQAYFVYPFIDESENADFKHIKYALKMCDQLQEEIYPDYRVALLHGKMSSDEKEIAMKKFQKGDIDILVSTTVIEVGVDVPNASVMVIENAERFGLSQLHQLRGRIGRGEHKSECYLVSSFKAGEDSARRLKIMTGTNNGFRIAEADLELRGPGDFLGTKQSGLPDFKFANIIRDRRVLDEARDASIEFIKNAKNSPENSELFKYVLNKWGDMLELSSIS